ncbi:MAG: GNAT family protein [Novosphingobium sp.]
MESLSRPLKQDDIRLVPYTEQHKEALRAACAEDTEIWEIYPVSLLGEHFDPHIAVRTAWPYWVNFVAFRGEEVVGITSYIRPNQANNVVEIGGTYIAPRVRGSGYNRVMKKLLIEHAFACGFERIVFLVDERNQRSQTAVLKLGATREGLLRRDRVTWTGHVRNTCVFGLLREEWHG